MTNEEKQVDWLIIIDSINEPRLIDHGCGSCYLADIGVATEVEQNTKRHDTNA